MGQKRPETNNKLCFVMFSVPPTLKSGFNSQKWPFDRIVIFTCNVDGNPSPNITWFFNGKQLRSNSRSKFQVFRVYIRLTDSYTDVSVSHHKTFTPFLLAHTISTCPHHFYLPTPFLLVHTISTCPHHLYLPIPFLLVHTISTCPHHFYLPIPFLHVHTISTCPYHCTCPYHFYLSIPFLLVHTISTCAHHFYLPSPFLLALTISTCPYPFYLPVPYFFNLQLPFLFAYPNIAYLI